MKLNVGDIIISKHPSSRDVEREILEVRKTGYTWCYPWQKHLLDEDYISHTWVSENSNDPFFDYMWELKRVEKEE